ncbi:PilZ domain-containing protein [Devosia faecipullorum]|uniref:PilZ domain-containing protein n=1 Tax=Devosia faecipullorum TaxID=2755039 RepID=UPI00187BC21B|nr:PilZ domain-containing protein [Devosia faecipullorum]MBE7732048.1 PilZ domain-containing protein [Devosia faecipullorum]
MFLERRTAARIAVNTRAIVVWGNDLCRAFAVILDLSSGGLRIRLDREAEIGEEGYILFDNRMEPFRLVWRASRSAGLQFLMPEEG